MNATLAPAVELTTAQQAAIARLQRTIGYVSEPDLMPCSASLGVYLGPSEWAPKQFVEIEPNGHVVH